VEGRLYIVLMDRGCCWGYAKEDSGVSSAELVTGSQMLHVPDPPSCVILPPPPMRTVSNAAATNSLPAHLAKGEHVYVHVGSQ
jgi:hypothetical protein